MYSEENKGGNNMNLYRILSVKWTECRQTNPSGEDIWWGPNSSGYTSDINQAGVYTEEMIEKHKRCHRLEDALPVKIEIPAWTDKELNSAKCRLDAERALLKKAERQYQKLKEELKEVEKTLHQQRRAVGTTESVIALQEMLSGDKEALHG
jgi:hypothetical protein